MSDDVWRRDEPQSPCVKVCVIDPVAGLCIGCLRSRDEIAGWAGMDARARRQVLADLPGRAPRLARRRGGRGRTQRGDDGQGAGGQDGDGQGGDGRGRDKQGAGGKT